MECRLEDLEKSQLVGLIEAMAKNLVALDGVWFQALEESDGMDKAMAADVEVWGRYPASEASRLKRLFSMGEHPGLEGLELALRFNHNALANEATLRREGDALVFRVEECRVQAARKRKGMELHPCKLAGASEYAAFAEAIDDRIRTECVSCHPDVTDPTCSCAWRFTIPDTLA